MQESTIRKYAAIMSESGLTGLEVVDGGETFRLEMNPPQQVFPGSNETLAKGSEQKIAYSKIENTESLEGALSEAVDSQITSVKSRNVGIFQATDSKGKPVAIEVGAEVEPGDVLGSIESLGKKKNIVTDLTGKVSEIIVTDGEIVDYGKPLYRILTR